MNHIWNDFFAWWWFDEFIGRHGDNLILTWCCHCSRYWMSCFWSWNGCWCSECIWCSIRWEFGNVVVFEIDFLILNIILDLEKSEKLDRKFSWSTSVRPRPAVKYPKTWVSYCVGVIGHHIRHAHHVTGELVIEKEHELSIRCSIIIQLEAHFNFMPISSRYCS